VGETATHELRGIRFQRSSEEPCRRWRTRDHIQPCLEVEAHQNDGTFPLTSAGDGTGAIVVTGDDWIGGLRVEMGGWVVRDLEEGTLTYCSTEAFTARYELAASTQPVSELPKNIADLRPHRRRAAAVVYAKFAGQDHWKPGEQPPGWPWGTSWFKPSGDDIRDLVKAGALIAAEIDRLQRADGVDLTQPVPESSGGVEEGRWRIEDSGDWLSRYDALTRQGAIAHTAKRLVAFFEAEGEPCTDEEAADEAAEIIDAALVAPNVEQEQDGVCVTFVAPPSTQPPSPQAEVEDCDDLCTCGHERFHHDDGREMGVETNCKARRNGNPCTCKQFDLVDDEEVVQQSPAEPQGDVVEEVLAKRLYEQFGRSPLAGARSWSQVGSGQRRRWHRDARDHLAAITPLLRSSYALVVRERLEASETKDAIFQEAVKHMSFESPEHQEEYVWQLVDGVVTTILAALDTPAPSEPEEGNRG
jgi:hypothetical protein